MLVDWMVEVQENFELNHETLYLSVKIVDMYLDKEKINRENLQLVGATSLFLACKYDVIIFDLRCSTRPHFEFRFVIIDDFGCTGTFIAAVGRFCLRLRRCVHPR